MDLWNSLDGTVTIQIVTADSAALLTALYQGNIPLENVTFLDALTFRCSIQRKHLPVTRAILYKRDEQYTVLGHDGFYWKLVSLLKRPVLILGIFLITMLTLFLPTRIYFFEVTGNQRISDTEILNHASQCGLEFGVLRRSIRSEKVKNALLDSMEDLEWVGINTTGCVATISVKERKVAQYEEEKRGVSSIVAARDGVISEVIVTRGTASVKPGQAVKAGQVLISGYTDCGLSIRAERARGEVYASTSHQISLVSPQILSQRGAILARNKKYSLIIGKKRINFYQDSGNLDTGCVKIYEQKYVTLPGGFQLPIAFVTESWISYDAEAVSVPEENLQVGLEQIAEKYLQGQMIAGRILSKQIQFATVEDILLLKGEYECLEMIARERIEEIITP